MTHLTSARRCILAAMQDPSRAGALLDEAAGYLDAALAWTLTPGVPKMQARRVARRAEELWAIMQCFEEQEAA